MGVLDNVAAGAGTGFAAGPWGALIGAGAGLFGSLFGAHMQSKSADRSAQLQSDAARYAAQMQDEAARRAELFQRQQAENAYRNNESTRRANYDQWASREQRLGSIGAMLGWGTRAIPGYVGGVDPRYTAQPPQPSSVGAALMPPPQRRQIAPGVTATYPPSVGASLMGRY